KAARSRSESRIQDADHNCKRRSSRTHPQSHYQASRKTLGCKSTTDIKHLMMRDPKTGKFERIATDSRDPKVAEAQIDAALKSGSACWIYTKDPSVQAFTDLMNRALDKPTEAVSMQHGGEVRMRWLRDDED